MRLLLDEMYPPAIAEQLRMRGHDVEAVAARAGLRSLPDVEIFSVAQAERRTVVTENVADFSILADRFDAQNQAHHGIVFVNPSKYPRGDARTIGRMVTALGDLLAGHPADDATSVRHWL